jgi:hypothetical protein
VRILQLPLAALLIACAGCAVLVPEAAELRSVDRAVADALNAARAPQAEQRAALARSQEAFNRGSDRLARLRLATLLALLPAPYGDPARASALLAPIADAASPGVGRLAALLATRLAEEQRLAREAERLARDSERTAREHERLDRERAAREEALRQQVEALREIERNVRQREEKLRRGVR